MTNDPESEAIRATWKLIAAMAGDMAREAEASETEDGLASQRIAQKMLTCVQQMLALDLIDKIIGKAIEANQRGEDYRPLLKWLADYAETNETLNSEDSMSRLLRGLISSANAKSISASPRGTYDQQQ